jgi:HEPN domain-containing protein
MQLVLPWLRKAEEDLAAANHLRDPQLQLFGAVAFHCQQAVEKYLKAVLTFDGVSFPKTHDIRRLLLLMNRSEPSLAASLQDASVLSAYGVLPRYPDDLAQLTEVHAKRAWELAVKARDAVYGALGQSPPRILGT